MTAKTGSSLRKYTSLLLSLALVLSILSGCKDSSSTEATSRELHIGISMSLDDARGVAALKFADDVEERTGGEITVTVTQDEAIKGELGLVNDLAAGKGDYDIIITDAANFAGYEPMMSISAMPYLFDDYETAWEFMDGPIEADIEAHLPSHNIRVLAHYCSGFRCITNSVRPVESPADLDGLVIRTPDLDLFLATIEALGADARPLSFSELYGSLQKKVYDGQENPIPLIYNNKLYETQEYLTLSNHIYSGLCFAISESVWESLPEEQQRIVSEAAAASAADERIKNLEQTETILQFLRDEGIIISEPDLTPFIAAAQSVTDKKSQRYGDYWTRTQEWLDNR